MNTKPGTTRSFEDLVTEAASVPVDGRGIEVVLGDGRNARSEVSRAAAQRREHGCHGPAAFPRPATLTACSAR